MTYLMFAAGLLGLFFGGEFLVRGAVGVAKRLHVPPMVIGLTIVGFGTSAPELLVSVQAALAGAPGLALGNVIGSNIANILLILGVAAVILPVPIRLSETRRDFVVMIGSMLVLWVLLLDHTFGRWEGLVFTAALVAYLARSLIGCREKPDPELEVQADGPIWKSMALAIGGFVVLLLGARFLVDSATEIARDFGVSEAVIGLTIVAIGTSLPELATSVMAAIRGHSEIAVGNILGSCIFNVLGILGITAMIEPISVDPRFAGFDMGLAVASGIAMLGFAALPGRVSRIGGALLVAAYAAYIAKLGLL